MVIQVAVVVLPMDAAVADHAVVVNHAVEILGAFARAAAGDLLPWNQNKGVKQQPWADEPPAAVKTDVAAQETDVVAPEADAETPADVEIPVNEEIPAVAKVPVDAEDHPADVPRHAAGEDSQLWILSNAGKLQRWADVPLTAVAEVAAAATDVADPVAVAEIPAAAVQAAEVQDVAVPAVVQEDHVRYKQLAGMVQRYNPAAPYLQNNLVVMQEGCSSNNCRCLLCSCMAGGHEENYRR